MMGMGEMWSHMGSIMATLMFVNAIIQQYFPYQIRGHVDKYTAKAWGLIYPYVQITFQEYTGDRFKRSEVYDAIQSYLSVKSSSRAKRLKASDIKDNKSVVLSPDDNEEVTDEFQGATLWWTSYKSTPKGMSMSLYPNTDEKRFYRLTFHRRHKAAIMESYLRHVIDEGKGFEVKNRQRKLYTNGSSENWWSDKRTKWSHVMFEHPATFETLALEPAMKKKILGDLVKFREGKEFYERVGKPWKRGYLLHGPPGTGKSTMISAMANFLDYDVYDLELTAVKDNTELKKLLIDSSNKSIIVIEDIDCSLDLTGQREKNKKKKKKDGEDEDEKKNDPMKKKMDEEGNKSKVTLSGLLNFIDGIWSACGGERVIIFTTNHVDKLDPALIRRGRMDLHIELTYCRFDAFRVLAKNYLGIPVGDSHPTFPEIQRLLTETDMTPADVAENLMAKSDEDDVDACLKSLIEALEQEKIDAAKRKEEEARLKAEEEEEEAKEKEEEKEKKKKKEAKEKEEEEDEKEKKKKKEEDGKECATCNGKSENGVKQNGSS